MLPLGLSAARQREFHRALWNHHTVTPHAQVLTLDHKVVANVSDMIVDGEVNFANDGETSRSASLSLFDPHGHIGFGDNDPSDGALFLNNMIRIILQYDWDDNTGNPVNVPIFTGPVINLHRNAFTIQVDCLGKEHFGLRYAWDPITYQVGYVTDIIKWLLRRSGETRWDIPDLKLITTESTVIWPRSQTWKHAQKLARSIDRQLFYDGRGIARLRKLPEKPVWIFEDGERGMLTSPPEVAYDVDKVRNRVWVKGRKPKGRDRVEGNARLPAANPFSAWRLGRGPERRGGELLETVENDRIKTDRLCHEHAVRILNRINRQQVHVQYEALVVPHLEEGDLVELDADDYRWQHSMRNYTIPLTGGVMSVGSTKNMKKGPKAKYNLLQPEVWGGTWDAMPGALWDTWGVA